MHRGHRLAALQVRDHAALDGVWLMPNAQPPHRSAPPVASPAQRLAMVRLAVADDRDLCASDVEVRRGGPSYTLDTIDQLRREFPDVRFALMLGSDQARHIQEWHAWAKLLASTNFILFARPGAALSPVEAMGLGFPKDRTQFVAVETPAIAAHEIRARLEQGSSIDELVEPAVARYIETAGLYRPNSPVR